MYLFCWPTLMAEGILSTGTNKKQKSSMKSNFNVLKFVSYFFIKLLYKTFSSLTLPLLVNQ